MAGFRCSLGTLSVDTCSLGGFNTDQHLFAVVFKNTRQCVTQDMLFSFSTPRPK